MISVSPHTQTWSKSAQQSAMKPEEINRDSPEEFKKAFGEKDIGEVLNKVADPNWVDPVKLRKVGNNQLDKDAFLKLLLAQLKYQDPTNPMQNHEMAAQLAQFSSLESLSNIDRGIGDLTKAAKPKQDFGALSLIGKVVSGDSAKITRTDEKEIHNIVYQLNTPYPQLKIKIVDAQNIPVKEFSLAQLKKGKNELNWNGLTEAGQTATPGEYHVVFESGGDGKQNSKVDVQTQFEGAITGINFTAQGPILLIGNQNVRLSDVRKIVDPKVKSETNVNSNNQITKGQEKISRPEPTT